MAVGERGGDGNKEDADRKTFCSVVRVFAVRRELHPQQEQAIDLFVSPSYLPGVLLSGRSVGGRRSFACLCSTCVLRLQSNQDT